MAQHSCFDHKGVKCNAKAVDASMGNEVNSIRWSSSDKKIAKKLEKKESPFIILLCTCVKLCITPKYACTCRNELILMGRTLTCALELTKNHPENFLSTTKIR